MTNRQYMLSLLQDSAFIDDGGAAYEAMVYYSIACPYFEGDQMCVCRDSEVNRENCFRCKEEWLDKQVQR